MESVVIPKSSAQISSGKELHEPAGASAHDVAILEKSEVISFWREKLAGSLPVLNLPSGVSAESAIQPRNEKFHLEIPSHLLKLSSREDKIESRFLTTLLVLLFRYTYQEDLIVGMEHGKSPDPEEGGLSPATAGILPLRVLVDEEISFKDAHHRVIQCCSEVASNSDVPISEIKSLLEPFQIPDGRLFQIVFRVGEFTTSELIESLEGALGWELDLLFSFSKTGASWKLQIQYKTSKFQKLTVQRFGEHFIKLLESALLQPQQLISRLQMLTAAEYHKYIREWNSTNEDFGSWKPITIQVEEQVQKSPDAVAVQFDQCDLKYSELNKRANQLAHFLRKHQIGPDVPVGICMERSIEMVVSVLAVLKAGGAYVPLDVAYPPERLAYMISDAKVPLILTQRHLKENLPIQGTGSRVIALGADWTEFQLEDSSNPKPLSGPNHLSYVIYTSGSTGQPKGVGMVQEALVNLLEWQGKTSTPRRNARVLQFASLSFDVSFQEIFSTWISGGTLLLIGEVLRRDMYGLIKYIHETQADRIFLPFVALQHLVEVAESTGLILKNLREVITAGEQLQVTPSMRRFFEKIGPSATLHNQYGPSESHVVTALVLKEDPNHWPALPSIGKPISNSQIYILDRQLQPVPVGVPGELYIGGVCLARGYLNRAELTSEKFIQNPFGAGRLYRSGDLARFQEDGNIEFLGRIDHQVKIRGYRIEIGEIEAKLREHPQIKEAAVIAREDAPGQKRLVGYVVPVEKLNGTSFAAKEIKAYLKGCLPEYMIPSAFVFLGALPLSPNKKVDRKALPAPTPEREGEAESIVGPRNETEKQLVLIWEKVLSVKPIGITDNFFDVGGHSFLATQVLMKIREVFSKELPLSAILEAPTIEQLSSRIQDKSTSSTSLVVMQPKGYKRPFFCIPGDDGHVFSFHHLARCFSPDRPFYGLQPAIFNGTETSSQTMGELAASLIREIKSVQPDGPYYIGGHCFGCVIAFEIAQQLHDLGEEVGLLVLLDPTTIIFPENAFLNFYDKSVYHLKKLSELSNSGRLSYFREKVENVTERFARRVKALYDAQLRIAAEIPYRLVKGYHLRPYPGRTCLFLAKDIFYNLRPKQDPRLRWAELLDGPVRKVELDGGHMSIFREPEVHFLAKQLLECLEQCPVTQMLPLPSVSTRKKDHHRTSIAGTKGV